MTQQREDQVIPYPKSRHFMEEAIRSTHHKPMMHGQLEVDVTRARAYLREVKARTGASLSFTAFVIACLGRAVDEHKYVHALRKGNQHLILFGDVDVLTWIEREIAGQPQVFPCIVRAANHKTFWEIHDQIRAAQVQDRTWPRPRWAAPRRSSSCRPGCFARTSRLPPGSGGGSRGRGSRAGGR